MKLIIVMAMGAVALTSIYGETKTSELTASEIQRFEQIKSSAGGSAIINALSEAKSPEEVKFVLSLQPMQSTLVPAPIPSGAGEKGTMLGSSNATRDLFRRAIATQSSVLWDIARLTDADPALSREFFRLSSEVIETHKEQMKQARDFLVMKQFAKRPSAESEADLNRVIREGKADAVPSSQLLASTNQQENLRELPGVKKLLNEDPTFKLAGGAETLAKLKILIDGHPYDRKYTEARDDIEAYFNGLAYGHYLKANGGSPTRENMRDFFGITALSRYSKRSALTGLLEAVGFQTVKDGIRSKASIPSDLVIEIVVSTDQGMQQMYGEPSAVPKMAKTKNTH